MMKFVAYLQRCKMYNTVDMRMGSEDAVKGSFITHIDVVKMRSLSAYRFNAIECFFGGIVEIVDNNDLVVGLEQGKGSEGANIASPPAIVESADNPGGMKKRQYPVIRTEPTVMASEVALVGQMRGDDGAEGSEPACKEFSQSEAWFINANGRSCHPGRVDRKPPVPYSPSFMYTAPRFNGDLISAGQI